jgi:hypothetical protein
MQTSCGERGTSFYRIQLVELKLRVQVLAINFLVRYYVNRRDSYDVSPRLAHWIQTYAEIDVGLFRRAPALPCRMSFACVQVQSAGT